MNSMDDLPPIDPALWRQWGKIIREYLGIREPGQKAELIVSIRMAERIARTIVSNLKKDPEHALRMSRSLKAVPELDALVARELQTMRVRRR